MTGPGAVSGGYGATPLAARSAAPAVTGAQAFTGTAVPSGPVHRNAPIDVQMPRAAPSEATAPATLSGPDQGQGQGAESDPVERAVAPVTQPATQAPRALVGAVGEVVAPGNQVSAPAGSLVQRAALVTQDVLAPLDELAQLNS